MNESDTCAVVRIQKYEKNCFLCSVCVIQPFSFIPVCEVSSLQKKKYPVQLQSNSVVSNYRGLVTELTLITLTSAEWKYKGDSLFRRLRDGKELQHDRYVRLRNGRDSNAEMHQPEFLMVIVQEVNYLVSEEQTHTLWLY